MLIFPTFFIYKNTDEQFQLRLGLYAAKRNRFL